MADWTFYAWESADTTAVGSALTISSSSALVFGGDDRSTFQSNITLNSWNDSLHWGMTTAESTDDLCTNEHLWPFKPNAGVDLTDDTGAIIGSDYWLMADGTPLASRGIGLKFTHGFGVKCHPVTIWAGTGDAVSDPPENCYIAIVDLTSSVPTWATVNPSTKLSLNSHNTEAEEHWWSVGIALMPFVVGHNHRNRVKISTTYY